MAQRVDPDPALACREFCAVVAAQLALALANSAAGAQRILRATHGLTEPDAVPAPAVHEIWTALQNEDLVRQNLAAVQACLTTLAHIAPEDLFDPATRAFTQALADLRAAYVMAAQDAADPLQTDGAPVSDASAREIELF